MNCIRYVTLRTSPRVHHFAYVTLRASLCVRHFAYVALHTVYVTLRAPLCTRHFVYTTLRAPLCVRLFARARILFRWVGFCSLRLAVFPSVPRDPRKSGAGAENILPIAAIPLRPSLESLVLGVFTFRDSRKGENSGGCPLLGLVVAFSEEIRSVSI